MILVVGATGQVGGMVANQLLAQKRKIRILVRPPSNYKPLQEAGAEVAFGDLKDRASLDKACQSIDTIITTANSAKRGGVDNPQTVDLEGNRSLIDAGKKAGLKHFIFVSVNIADPNSPVPFLQAKGKTEHYLQSSGLSHTILAPDFFMEDWIGMVVARPVAEGQPVTVVGAGERRHSFVSALDVAKFIVACVDNPLAANRKLIIGGPDAVSFRDAAATFSRVTGRQIEVRSIQPNQPVPGIPDPVLPLLAALDTFDSVLDMKEVSHQFGVELTSMEDFARLSMSGRG